MTATAPAQPARAEARGSSDTAVLGGALITTALLAGLYYGWAVSVMPGLARTDDVTFVESIQDMNEAIVNPAFMVAFLGAPALSAVAYVQWRRRRPEARSKRVGQFLLAALLLNLAGLAMTAGANMPLNDRIKAFGDPHGQPAAAVATARADFEGPWTRRHLLRTAFTVGALGCLSAAVLIDRGTQVNRQG